jgi:mono/diheme cytochrome c family protein
MKTLERIMSLCLAAALCAAAPVTASADDAAVVERGRYLVRIAGCNDCHTAGYPQADGLVPESDWLMGDRLGWRGPWGTTYPGNLRLFVAEISEEQWLAVARSARFRPPMPWFALRDMSDEDLVAIYRLLRHLGPAGEPVPEWVPPGHEPKGPYVLFPAPPQ